MPCFQARLLHFNVRPSMIHHILSCTTAGSVVLTQTHPAAPYVCRTGNITLRCQYDGVEDVLSVVWVIGFKTTSNASTITGHTALPHTTTYQEVVVDSYTNLEAGYRCVPTLRNGSRLNSNTYIPQNECECYQTTSKFHCIHRPTWLASNMFALL